MSCSIYHVVTINTSNAVSPLLYSSRSLEAKMGLSHVQCVVDTSWVLTKAEAVEIPGRFGFKTELSLRSLEVCF